MVIDCGAIALAFTPTGQYGVTGTYEPDSSGGCLMAIPLAGNAPETGRLAWHAIQSAGLHMVAGRIAFQPIKPPGPQVTLQPNQTIQVELGYDPYTNTTYVWPR